MLVTDEHLAWLRACLTGDDEALRQASPQVAGAGAAGLGALVQAALALAARRSFAPGWTGAEVTAFVARVHALLSERADLLDPPMAEQQLRRALGEKLPGAPDPRKAGPVQLILLEALIRAGALDEEAVAGLLAQARPVAERILAAGPAT